MTEPAWEELRRQLSAEPPSALARLPADRLGHLSQALREARHRQAQALGEAGEQAFGYVPRVLRGPIRRILG
jgi:hypothetical protein